MATPETRRQLLAAVAACDDKKGEDTRILELDPVDSGLADFFLITSATNDRQVIAIADEIEFRLKKEFGLYATSVEGRRQGEWILLDYTDIVIHVFLAEKRAFYDIERLRKSARNLSAADVEAELKSALAKKTLAVRKSAPAVKASKNASAVAAKKSAKGESSVSAKPAKKAAKKAPAKTAAAKPAPAKKAVAKKAPAKKAGAKKAPAKVAKKAAPVAVGVKSPGSAQSRFTTGGFNAKSPTVGAEAPGPVASFGARPPIEKAEAPEAMSLAASAAPEAAKKAAKKAPAKKAK
jgi:ribosome-associated protein